GVAARQATAAEKTKIFNWSGLRFPDGRNMVVSFLKQRARGVLYPWSLVSGPGTCPFRKPCRSGSASSARKGNGLQSRYLLNVALTLSRLHPPSAKSRNPVQIFLDFLLRRAYHLPTYFHCGGDTCAVSCPLLQEKYV